MRLLMRFSRRGLPDMVCMVFPAKALLERTRQSEVQHIYIPAQSSEVMRTQISQLFEQEVAKSRRAAVKVHRGGVMEV